MFICLTPHSTIFQLNRSGQFYWWRKPDPGENHRQTLSQTAVLSTPRLSGFRTHNSSGDRH